MIDKSPLKLIGNFLKEIKYATLIGSIERHFFLFISAPFVIYLIGICAFRFRPTDPDLWWHLNIGKDILIKGFQFYDKYSYSLPDYRWVDHEWLLNLLMYSLYSIPQNTFLLALIFCFLTVFSFYYLIHSTLKNSNSATKNFTQCLLMVLVLLVAQTCMGIRAQTITTLGVSLLWQLLQNENWIQRKTVIWILPFGFTLWANLHGGVIIGLSLLALDLFARYLEDIINKKDNFINLKSHILLILICFFATLVNPYGLNIYNEAFTVFSDTYAHQVIDEWRAPDFSNLKYIGLLFCYIVLFVFLIRKSATKQVSTLNKLAILIFAILSFRSVRHTSLFLLISLPTFALLLDQNINYIYEKVQSKSKLLLCSFSLVLMLFVIPFANDELKGFVKFNTQKNLMYSEYPLAALDFIRKYTLSGNILAEYGWGGFIPWYSPSVKVFIDGRMPSWRSQNGLQLLPEFYKVIGGGTGIKNTLQKYNINYFLLNSMFYRPSNYPEWEPVFWNSTAIFLVKKEEAHKFIICGI
jgi:hypothetical protein